MKPLSQVERMKQRILLLERDMRQQDAELQRHKRAIEWLVSNSEFWQDSVPSDIADLVKGAK